MMEKDQKIDLPYCRVLVTPTSFGKTNPALKSTLESVVGEVIYNPTHRPLTAGELCPLIHNVDGYIAGLDQIDTAVIQAANRLKVIARYGVGADRVDIAAATKRSIVVTNTPGVNSVAVAELAIGLMLALARNLCQANQATRRGEWPRHSGVELLGKTVGLVGFGAIAREVAARLSCFGCQILAIDPYVQPQIAEKYGVRLVTLDELLATADFVSLHVPTLPTTVGMVNRNFLQRMKPGAFLVNTARGELIDETALEQALENGHLGGAALDCLQQEPPGADHPLFRFPQVIITPHTGAHTNEATNLMGRMSLDACLSVLRGERPLHVVNPEVFAGEL